MLPWTAGFALLSGLTLLACDSAPERAREVRDASVGAPDAAATRPLDAGITRRLDATLALPPPRCGDYDVDEDGLDYADEVDAGLDPCRADTNSDGCGDAEQYYFAGCDPRNTLFSDCEWWTSAPQGLVRFVAPARANGVWPRLTLRADASAVVRFVSMADAGLVGSDDGVSSVPPGSQLTFRVSVGNGAPAARTVLTLVDENGVTLDQGTAVYIAYTCPLII